MLKKSRMRLTQSCQDSVLDISSFAPWRDPLFQPALRFSLTFLQQENKTTELPRLEAESEEAGEGPVVSDGEDAWAVAVADRPRAAAVAAGERQAAARRRRLPSAGRTVQPGLLT